MPKQRINYAALNWDEILQQYQFGESEYRPGQPPSQTELAKRYGVGCRKNFGVWFRAEAARRNIRVRPREEAAGMPRGAYTGTGANRHPIEQ